MWAYAKQHKHEIFLIILFLIAAGVRLNLDGMPLTHPGNIKAADPFYHSITTDMIIDSHQWRYNPYYVSFGEGKSINQQPPLVYTASAGINSLSGLPSWVIIYFLVAFFAGLRTLIMYALSQEFFNNKNISILVAALTVLPIEPKAWLYEVYIGFWIQVIALTLLLGIIWCTVRYARTTEEWLLWIIGAVSGAILMIHPQEILFLPLVFGFLFYHLLNEKSFFWKKVKKITKLCILPVLSLLTMLPWFLYVWKSKSYNFAINLDPFPTSYLGGITTPGLGFFPTWYLIIAGLGIILALIWWKTQKPLLTITGYYSFFVFLIPFFFVSPYYLGRTKVLLPLILAPFISLAIHFVLKSLEKTVHKQIATFTTFVLISLAIIFIAIPEYQDLRNNLKGEHIDPAKWSAFSWIHSKTLENATFLFLEDCGQASCLYTKRITAYIEQKDLAIQAQSLLNTHELNKQTLLSWAADTLWDYPTQEKSRFYFVKLDKELLKTKHSKLRDFTHIYMRNYNKELAQFHQQLIETLSKEYKIAYNTGGIIILQHA